MELEYDLDMTDLVAFNEHRIESSEYARRTMAINNFVTALVPIVAGIVFFIITRGFEYFISGFILAVPFYIIWPKLEKRRRRKESVALGSEGRFPALESKHVMRIEAGGLIDKTCHVESRWEKSGIVRIGSTENHTFLYTAPGAALVIPKKKVTRGDYDAFVKVLMEEFHKPDLIVDDVQDLGIRE